MNRDSSQNIKELLIDFADGVLTDAEATQIRAHLEQCPDCCATAQALRQSLQCAQAIWQDNALPAARSRPWRLQKWPYVAAAAGIFLAVGILLYRPTPQPPAPSAPTLAEIEDRIAASGRAARLLARVDQLETQALLRDVAQSQYRYLVEKYPDTPAAAAARLKLESLR
ncbi:MAG: zf-HC2 domain-containing protein [Phycisphaerales bacterium]|nr:MAG: zf-HC2 domain-containing protein [Phycisphaerales bacterium]